MENLKYKGSKNGSWARSCNWSDFWSTRARNPEPDRKAACASIGMYSSLQSAKRLKSLSSLSSTLRKIETFFEKNVQFKCLRPYSYESYRNPPFMSGSVSTFQSFTDNNADQFWTKLWRYLALFFFYIYLHYDSIKTMQNVLRFIRKQWSVLLWIAYVCEGSHEVYSFLS